MYSGACYLVSSSRLVCCLKDRVGRLGGGGVCVWGGLGWGGGGDGNLQWKALDLNVSL